jgi:hypothetical protein
MAGFDLTAEVPTRHHAAARDFLEFLQSVGRKYPVQINFRSVRPGRFYVMINGRPGAIDSLLQELILNRGLYYYCCSFKSEAKADIIRTVIVTIFQQLLEDRFRFTQSKFLRRHVLGRMEQNSGVPGDFSDPFAHEYEVAFRKWDVKILSDWDFIKDTDAILTRFLLRAVNHRPGDKSPEFNQLLHHANTGGIAMDREVRKSFEKLHLARTRGLHRSTSASLGMTLNELALRLYMYFEYFDDFQESQQIKTVKINGKRRRRIKYGDESPPWPLVGPRPCHDCYAVVGQYHCDGCDSEQCPGCRGQRLGCPSCKEDE